MTARRFSRLNATREMTMREVKSIAGCLRTSLRSANQETWKPGETWGRETWGREAVKKLANVHIQILLRTSLPYTV